MKKFLVSLILLSGLVLPMVVVLGAAPSAGGTAPEVDPLKALETITNYVFYFLIMAAVIALIIAGFDFVTAGGEATKVQKAHDFVLYAIIGIIVAVLAKGVSYWIVEKLK